MKTLATPFRGKYSHLTEDGQTTVCGKRILPHWDTYLTEDMCARCGHTGEFIAAAKAADLPRLFIPIETLPGQTIEAAVSRELALNPLWTDQMTMTVYDGKNTVTKMVHEWLEALIPPDEE